MQFIPIYVYGSGLHLNAKELLIWLRGCESHATSDGLTAQAAVFKALADEISRIIDEHDKPPSEE